MEEGWHGWASSRGKDEDDGRGLVSVSTGRVQVEGVIFSLTCIDLLMNLH